MKMRVLLPLLLTALILVLPACLQAQSPGDYFTNSYAIVVGIRDYADSRRWPQLINNENDADAIGDLLKTQGFKVKLFKSRNATKQAIESYIEDILAPKLQLGDRVVFYFSGHGETVKKGNKDFGYVIPYKATSRSSSWISMDRLQTLADMMGSARHQLFIFDACFGGLFALKSSLSAIPENYPDYVSVVSEARARQYLTAGGPSERTPAVSNLPGYSNYSFFTAHLIQALREDKSDLNKDGVITASELDVYLGPAARSRHNTPRGGSFAGHEQGNFVLQASRSPLSIVSIEAKPSNILKGSSKLPFKKENGCYVSLPELSSCKDRLSDGSEGPVMVTIPGGTFMMGSTKAEKEYFFNETPRHRVTIRPFAIGQTEVTFDEYDRFAKATGRKLPDDSGMGRGRRPVINVSWLDATAYVDWLSEQTDQPYRLLSESEWEYAARAGTETPFSTGSCISAKQANFNDNYAYADCPKTNAYKEKTVVVASYPPNLWNLYDMHGNVWEWTADCWHNSYVGAPTNGSQWGELDDGNCNKKVVRGGSWYDFPQDLRSANRDGDGTDVADDYIGFRVARTL